MRRSAIWAFGLLAIVASACGAPHVDAPRRTVAPIPGSALTVAFLRAHPTGPEADEITRWPSASLTPLGPTGWRHPVWRGCQHVYDPALSSYLFEGVAPQG